MNDWLNPRRRVIEALKKKRSAKSTMGSIFNTFLLIILGLALTPSVDNMVTDMLENLTGAAAQVGDQIPLIWIFIIVGIGAAAVYVQFKDLQ